MRVRVRVTVSRSRSRSPNPARLVDGGHAVAAADDGDAPAIGELRKLLRHGVGALGVGRLLENAHGAVPQHGPNRVRVRGRDRGKGKVPQHGPTGLGLGVGIGVRVGFHSTVLQG